MSVFSEPSVYPTIIIFGKPGAGKTTVANAAENIILKSFKRLNVEDDSTDECKQHHQSCINLDLDVCIPAWMKINFSRGIYPSLSQRAAFAESACDYVETEVRNVQASLIVDASISIIIAFSFVNSDLRDIFRSRFPNATWALVDVSDELAQDRINKRVDHFYKGVPVEKSEGKTLEVGKAGQSKSVGNNDSEWVFAPVNFHHIILDGRHSIVQNANRVAETLTEERS